MIANQQHYNQRQVQGVIYSGPGDRRVKGPEFGFCSRLLIFISIFLLICLGPIGLCLAYKMVKEYQRAVYFRLGQLLPQPKGPGLICHIPCTDVVQVIDVRTRIFDVPPQEVLTRDSVTVQMDAVVYYRADEACMSVVNVVNADHATRLLAQTTLRNVMGACSLSDVLAGRERIQSEISELLDVATDAWGIKVERVEIKDVRLPPQLQRAMAAEAEATREAKAKVIAAEGEMNSSRKLKEAADVMEDSPNAIMLRYLQTLNTISAEKNSTVIFPLPMEMIPSY